MTNDKLTDRRTARPRRTRQGLRAFCLLFVLGLAACGNPMGPDTSQLPVDPNLAVSSGPTAQGKTYYVSPSGNNGTSGLSPSLAWRTIDKVNKASFVAGDRILFEGGATFAGQLSLNASDKGTASSPVIVSSYGTGRATIDAGTGTAIMIYNASGFEIRNLAVVGSGRTTNGGIGVAVYADLGGSVKLPYIRIDSVEASGFGYYGISIGSWNGATGFSDVRVTNASTHDNGRAGVISYAQAMYAHQNVYFGHLTSYLNPGVASLTFNSGSGIVMGAVSGGVIERSVAFENGWLSTASEGPVGIWTYDSEGIVIQHNESYRNRTGGPADGGGFDLDQNTRNSVLQYNYTHDNDGPGLLLAQSIDNTAHSGNIVRYNISQNDGRRNSHAAISVWGQVIGTEIYNNSVFIEPSSTGAPLPLRIYNAGAAQRDVRNLHVRNNILVSTGGLQTIDVSADQINGATDLRLEGNRYYAAGTPMQLQWGSVQYASLATWRTATGQERIGTLDVGSTGVPGYTSPGRGGTIGNADLLHTLTAYKLKATSTIIDKGLDLRTFGLNPGSADFYSGSIASGSAFDVGAHEWR